jgi:hypothetical protein
MYICTEQSDTFDFYASNKSILARLTVFRALFFDLFLDCRAIYHILQLIFAPK